MDKEIPMEMMVKFEQHSVFAFMIKILKKMLHFFIFVNQISYFNGGKNPDLKWKVSWNFFSEKFQESCKTFLFKKDIQNTHLLNWLIIGLGASGGVMVSKLD